MDYFHFVPDPYLWLVISIRNVVSSTGIEDVPICTALIGHLRLR
mgnify:CR=1 FL=1